jgi:outer membrane protein assembly factor BamB
MAARKESGFSPLEQIDKRTVTRLGLAWFLDLDHEQVLEATPLAVNGVLYFTGGHSAIYAVAALSGKLLWKFDPQVWKQNPNKLRFTLPVNRGAAYADGRVFSGTLDGRLVAIDAKTGELLTRRFVFVALIFVLGLIVEDHEALWHSAGEHRVHSGIEIVDARGQNAWLGLADDVRVLAYRSTGLQRYNNGAEVDAGQNQCGVFRAREAQDADEVTRFERLLVVMMPRIGNRAGAHPRLAVCYGVETG